ncbi:MAG: PH domain-containing protein [Actinomycetota bacterium]
MPGLTRNDEGFDRFMIGRGIKSGFTSRRPYSALMDELGPDEQILDAAKGKVGNGLGYLVVTDRRVIVVGQAVAALGAETSVAAYPHDAVTAVDLLEGKFQSTLTMTTPTGAVTIDNMTAGAQRIASSLRTVAGTASADAPDPDAERRCPYCAEMIKVAAIKCRFCGEFL